MFHCSHWNITYIKETKCCRTGSPRKRLWESETDMHEIHWGLLLWTAKKHDCSHEAVATVVSDNPTGSLPSGMALQNFYVWRQEVRILSPVSTSHWMQATLGVGLTLAEANSCRERDNQRAVDQHCQQRKKCVLSSWGGLQSSTTQYPL